MNDTDRRYMQGTLAGHLVRLGVARDPVFTTWEI